MARWVFQPLPLLREMERRYGPTVLIPGRPPMLWLGDPDAVRDLFAGDPEVLHAGEANAVLEGVLGRWSMFLLDGEAHRRERKLIMPALHGERMRAYTEAMRRAAREATRRWRPGERFSFLAEMQAVTLDVMARTVFGVGDASATWRLRDLLRALVPRVQEPGLFLAASVFGSARVRRWIDAGARPHRLPGGVTFDPSPLLPGGRMVSLLREIEALLYAEFAERRRRGDTAARTDVLSLLLQARDESGAGMTDEQLRDEMITLLIAGHDTSAIALAWAMHHLLAHPEALHRLEAEVRAALARADASDAIADLAYLDAVIKESMRLTPIVPVIQRLTRAPVRLGRHEVPAGVLVMAQVYTIHHRADLYPEPDRFRPERFLARRYAPHEHFPFGGGVRRCVGAAFATHSMKMVLAEVVAGAKLERVGPEARLERRGVLFAPSGGLVVRRVRASPR
jgi:cytochrome P450